MSHIAQNEPPIVIKFNDEAQADPEVDQKKIQILNVPQKLTSFTVTSSCIEKCCSRIATGEPKEKNRLVSKKEKDVVNDGDVGSNL